MVVVKGSCENRTEEGKGWNIEERSENGGGREKTGEEAVGKGEEEQSL